MFPPLVRREVDDLGVGALSLSLSDLPFPFLLCSKLIKIRNGGLPLGATKAGVIWRVHTVLEYHLLENQCGTLGP